MSTVPQPEPASSNAPASASASPNAIQVPLTQLLLWATVVNFVLIFGGTLYSQITVNSIQKSYQEAESRLNESKAKYQEASSQLEQQRLKASQARNDIDSLVKSFDKLDAQLSEVKKESARKLDSIADEARAQLTQLKNEKASIGTALHALETEMKATITQNSTKIRSEVEAYINDARTDVAKSRDRLQLLANDIAEQKSNVDKKNLEIQDLHLTSNRTLETVRDTDKALKEELARLRQSRELDPSMLWTHSGWLLRSVYIGIALSTILSLILSIVAIRA